MKELVTQIESLDELWPQLKRHLGEDKDYKRFIFRNTIDQADPLLRPQLQRILSETSEAGEIET